MLVMDGVIQRQIVYNSSVKTTKEVVDSGSEIFFFFKKSPRTAMVSMTIVK